MRFLTLAALGTLLLCSCRTRSTASEVFPHSVPNTPNASDAAKPLRTQDMRDTEETLSDSVTTIPVAILRYRTAWDKIHATQGPVRLPEFWALADSAGDALGQTMEQFSEATFQRAESLMVWHVLVRSETVGASPMYDSFLALARLRGTPSDTAYFAYLATQEGGWKWKTQVTDYSACDELGSPFLLTALVGAERLRDDSTSPYRDRFPDPAVDVRASLKYGLCACGQVPTTRRDFERNLAQAHPPASLRPLLDSLRAILRAPRPNDRFECNPG